jgi:RNA polymerase sigma-70 factor, ECF subfamily
VRGGRAEPAVIAADVIPDCVLRSSESLYEGSAIVPLSVTQTRYKLAGACQRLMAAQVLAPGTFLRVELGEEGERVQRIVGYRWSMNTTPVSLLERLRQPGNQPAWDRFVDLYTPLLYHWGRRAGLQEPDVADLVQDVFQILIRKMSVFEYDQDRTFRGWLRTILLNQWRSNLRRRTEKPLGNGDAHLVVADKESDLIEKEYREYLVARAMHVMKTDFEAATWQACWEHVACGRPVADVAGELGITVNAVYLAKARVLRRLREELAGLWD